MPSCSHSAQEKNFRGGHPLGLSLRLYFTFVTSTSSRSRTNRKSYAFPYYVWPASLDQPHAARVITSTSVRTSVRSTHIAHHCLCVL
jgi:hypothetical protein